MDFELHCSAASGDFATKGSLSSLRRKRDFAVNDQLSFVAAACKHPDKALLPIRANLLREEIAEAWVCRVCGQCVIRLAPPDSEDTSE